MTATTVGKLNGRAGDKPLILIATFPGEGHTIPLLDIAAYLVQKDYEVVFLAPRNFRGKVEEAKAEWVHMDNPFSNPTFTALGTAASLPAGPERFASQIKTVFLDTLPARTERITEVLAMLKARDHTRQIIVIEDVFNWSFLPFRYGRSLPQGFTEMPKTIGIGVAVFMIESQDTGPVTLGLPPDSTPSGRRRNEILQDLVEKGPMKPMMDSWREAMRKTGCTNIPDKHLFRHCYTAHDVSLQLCFPSLEYPISDLPPSIKFIGVMPRKLPGPNYQYPSWWSEVKRVQENNNNKYRHVVFISQGTVNGDYSELVLPSVQAFADSQDVLVIVTLGVRGAQLPSEFVIPPNTRVADYLPYDAILEYTDVFVSNAGYGALTHSVRNGVPIVLAGENEEKIEVTMRAVYAGLGISLATQRPTAEQIKQGVEQVLQDTKYKKAAMKLKREGDSMDTLAMVEAKVKEFTK